MKFLFAGMPISDYADAFPDNPPIDASDPNRHYWWPVAPNLPERIPEAPTDHATSEESFRSTVVVQPEVKAEFYRQIAKDFITRFKGG
jgi:hypothetical protein